MAEPRHRPDHSPEALTLGRIEPRAPGVGIEVLSDALGADGAIDLRHSAYGDNLSPPLRWTPVEGAGAYAIVVEDPDAPMEHPFVHWTIWNIPGEATAIQEGVSMGAELTTPQGARQGRNDNGSTGYFGPRPPRRPRRASLPFPDLRSRCAAGAACRRRSSHADRRDEGAHAGRRRAGGNLRGARPALAQQPRRYSALEIPAIN